MGTEWRRGNQRWNSKDQIRVSRRFRHHVRTPKNPKGRIHRELCFNAEVCGNDQPAEFHHIDYGDSFLGVWACFKCHRKIERETLKFHKKDIWNYNSVVVRRTASVTDGAPSDGSSPPDLPF